MSTKQGSIVQWFEKRGFGFIQGENGKNFFFHISDWDNDAAYPPEVGEKVRFEYVVADKRSESGERNASQCR